ncbi:prophage CP4-57 regulatory family protein [Acinetobacter sp. 1295259]|nr:prophage CP4-57 regulatory family protein [Acinetobacter sp. 1295259]
MGESTIWNKVRSGDFPQPIRLSTRLTVWRIEDIEEWIKSKELGV